MNKDSKDPVYFFVSASITVIESSCPQIERNSNFEEEL